MQVHVWLSMLELYNYKSVHHQYLNCGKVVAQRIDGLLVGIVRMARGGAGVDPLARGGAGGLHRSRQLVAVAVLLDAD